MYGEYMYEVQQPTAENRWLGAYKCTICQFAKWSNLAATMAHNQVSLHGMFKDHGVKKRVLETKYREEWATARNAAAEGGEPVDGDVAAGDAEEGNQAE